jgi:hypothetical protein
LATAQGSNAGAAGFQNAATHACTPSPYRARQARFPEIQIEAGSELDTPLLDVFYLGTIPLSQGELTTRLGCGGNDCEVITCTPAPPESLIAMEGRLELRHDLRLIVSSVDWE